MITTQREDHMVRGADDTLPQEAEETALRKSFFGLLGIFSCFLLATVALKIFFIASLWTSFRREELHEIVRALWVGLRFDISILSYLFFPAILLSAAMLVRRTGLLKWLFIAYLAALALFVMVFSISDIYYFREAGKHFTYEFFSYLNTSALPVVSGAFRLHPWLTGLSVFISIAASLSAGLTARWCAGKFLAAERPRTLRLTVMLALVLALAVIGARGGLQGRPVKIANSVVSSSPSLNALSLNPLFSALKSRSAFSSKPLLLSDEQTTIRTVRGVLGNQAWSGSFTHPMLRMTSGTAHGNRKNVVIIILESWSGKDIGCLGNGRGLTPNFDKLAGRGMLFTRFYATGVRTTEGIFSILCSFPNQPPTPVMKTAQAYQTHWRSISQILEEAGYTNIFVHGRDLKFDNMERFLKTIHFHRIIDRSGFPPSVSPIADSWPGYSDEDVFRRADEEFAALDGRPFLGVVYTMNTHPPFVTPEGFPLALPPDSESNKFLNALHYSDHSLKVFFELAGKRPYFKNTVFLLVADHARTRDTFDYCDQHAIPLLIYSPGYVEPGRSRVVGSQLDILPTILGLLHLKTEHGSWGQNLLEVPADRGFALSIAGNDVRWRDGRYLINDTLDDRSVLLFDTGGDDHCRRNIWEQHQNEGELLKTRLRSYLSLSQKLLLNDRIYRPPLIRDQQSYRDAAAVR